MISIIPSKPYQSWNPLPLPYLFAGGMGLILSFYTKGNRAFVGWMFSTELKGLWAKFILRCPGHSAEDPFWAFILFSWCLGHDKPQVLFSLEDPLYSGYPFYFVPHPRDGGSSFLFCCKLLLFTLYFGLSVGLGFTYSLSSLGIWVWPFESPCSHLLGDSPCLVGLEFMKKGVSTLLFL